jgi:uncharacterized repeat protein (TIGR04076 family)
MAEKFGYKVKIKQLSITRSCGHKVGDEWIISNDTMFWPCPEGFCAIAFHGLYPDIRAMRYGLEPPAEGDEDVMVVCCPDYGNPAEFEIRRIRE